jgi:hypothetical protein
MMGQLVTLPLRLGARTASFLLRGTEEVLRRVGEIAGPSMPPVPAPTTPGRAPEQPQPDEAGKAVAAVKGQGPRPARVAADRAAPPALSGARAHGPAPAPRASAKNSDLLRLDLAQLVVVDVVDEAANLVAVQ